MISYIKWKIIELDFNNITILTSSDLWYEIHINELTYSRINIWEDIELFVYHHITENNQTLFWFLEKEERHIFKELIKISGVWWKVAMQILSLWIERLVFAIKNEDNKTIEAIKWIWKKMAEKIILELKDKDFKISFENKDNLIKANTIWADLHISIKSTLTNMWYNPRDIDKILWELPEWMTNAADIIPFVIRELS